MTTASATAPLFDSAFLARLDRLAIATKRALAGDLQGERRSPRRGTSVEFADFKAYVPGDDFRQIDWNLYARLERFFLKLFVAEEEATIHLLIDTSRSMDWGEPNKLHYAKLATGAMGYLALGNLDRVTLNAFGQPRHLTMPPVRTRRGALALFQFLQELRAGGSTDFAAFCASYARTARHPGPLLLCSDLLDEGWEAGLRSLLARRFDVTLLHILAPGELEPAIDGEIALIDAESGTRIELTADAAVIEDYRRRLAVWRDELGQFCAGHGIAYVPITTSFPIDALLFDLLRRKGIVR